MQEDIRHISNEEEENILRCVIKIITVKYVLF